MDTVREARESVLMGAAQLIADARRAGRRIPRLSPTQRPHDEHEAIRIQQAVTELLGADIRAWKCSLPKPGRIPCAPIFDVFPSGTVPVWCEGREKIIEPEVAFVLDRDLPARAEPYTEAEVRAAVGVAHLVVEIIGCRFEDFMATDFFEKMSDHILNEALIIGPTIPIERAENLKGFHFRVSTGLEAEATHPEGVPFPGMVWLANYLRESSGLKQGDVVTTGSYAGFVHVPVGQPLRLDYGDLGTIELELKCK